MFEVDVPPLQSIRLAGSHPCEEPHGEVVTVVGANGDQDRYPTS